MRVQQRHALEITDKLLNITDVYNVTIIILCAVYYSYVRGTIVKRINI